MITVRRSAERHHLRGKRRHVRVTFHAGRTADVFARGFGPLARFDEHRLESGARVRIRPGRAVDVVTYVLAGVIASRDSTQTTVLRTGDFHRVSGVLAPELHQHNRSARHPAEVLQLWFSRSTHEREPTSERRRFSTAERRGVLRLVACSDDAHGDLLRVQPGVLIYSAILDPGHHIVYELGLRRSAWLHVIRGEALSDMGTLGAGDAACFTLERAVSLTALAPTEILLVELAHLASAPPVRTP